jgi:hypothetical protein
MRCETHATIAGELDDVLAVALPAERWALLLPSYQWVRYHGRSGQGTALQFAARLGVLPLRWTAEQIAFPDEGRIVYRHLRGLASGMWSEWRLTQAGDAVEVTVRHRWQPNPPIIGEAFARLVAVLWVRPLTQATLDGIARQVQDGHAAALRRLNQATSHESRAMSNEQ